MANVHALLSLYFLLNFILVISNVLVCSDGLKLRMIHSHLFYKIIFLMKKESKCKLLNPIYALITFQPCVLMSIDVHVFHYLVKVGIGTFGSKRPYKEYYLEMDTGSDLVWLQCEGCTKCFNQNPPPFPKDKSSSFRPILTHNNHMTYNISYGDGDHTKGILARETFYIKTEERGIAKIENIQFGCGLDNMLFWEYNENNKIAGIMGLGWDDKSFVHQLDPKIKGRFSYCLPVIFSEKAAPSTYLRFGDDIPHNRNTKSTALYKKDEECYYYVKMQGISINNVRLNVSQRVFTFNNKDSKSDWIIDTGTTYSRIITPAFRMLKLELKKYFSRFKGLKEFKPDDSGLELCYRTSKGEGFKNLPDITFHLQGSQADFILKAEAGFEIVTRPRKYFCLAMFGDNTKSFIGAHQQTNHRIIYDTRSKQLNFYPEDCSKNP